MVLLACNATGTSKLTPVFIHKFKNPRCMQNIRKNDLPVYYYWNLSAWMQSSIFFLIGLANSIQICERKDRRFFFCWTMHQCILWKKDFHFHITLHYLPPNTTAHLQPCDAGIIYSFKVSKFCMKFFYSYILIFLLVEISPKFMQGPNRRL